MSEDALGFNVVSFFPKDFINKNVNEPFIKKIMAYALHNDTWILGNPDIFEPDYFCNGVPFEFTIASNTKRKNNFIQQYFWRGYSSEDVENDVFSYIIERINDKASKKYSVGNVHLCILCILDLFNWVSDYYGSVTHALTDYHRKEFFDKIRSDYISQGVFSNIFIIFPDWTAKWWVYDVLSENRIFYQLTDEEIKSGEVPYVAHKDVYDEHFGIK